MDWMVSPGVFIMEGAGKLEEAWRGPGLVVGLIYWGLNIEEQGHKPRSGSGSKAGKARKCVLSLISRKD